MTYFILWAYTGTFVRKNSGEVFGKKCRLMERRPGYVVHFVVRITWPVQHWIRTMVCDVAFSSQGRIMGKGSTNHSLPALCFLVFGLFVC